MPNRANSERRQSRGRRDDKDRRIVPTDIDGNRRNDQRRITSSQRRLQMDRRLLQTYLTER